MKLRVLTATKKGKLLTIAEMLSKEGGADYAVDVIPPAYACDRERLVIVVASVAAKMPNAFSIFCKDLSKSRAQHVALLVDGKAEHAATIVDWIKNAGAHVCDEILYMNGGLPFKFTKSVSDEEKQAASEWLKRIFEDIGKA